ncbi:MAG: ATP-binding protein [Halobacteria archaeon]
MNKVEVVLEGVQDAVFITENRGEIRSINESAENLYGFERQEVLGENISRFLSEFPAREEFGEDMGQDDGQDNGQDTGQDNGQVRPRTKEYTAEAYISNDVHLPVVVKSKPLEIDDQELVMISVRDVSRTTELESEIRRNEKALNELEEVASERERNYDEKIKRILDIGTNRMSLPIGYLTSINFKDESIKITHAVGGHEKIRRGYVFPLDETFTHEILRTGGQDCYYLDEPELPEDIKNSPAQRNFGFESFIGTIVEVEERVYGSLCFADTEPSSTRFTHSQKDYIDLFSAWIEYETRMREYVKQLKVFDRVLRHDLRNKTNIIMGYVQKLQQDLDGPEHLSYMEEIINTCDNILNTSKKARRINEVILKGENHVMDLDISRITRRNVDKLDHKYPDVDVRTDIQDDLIVPSVPKIDEAIKETVENAIVHNDKEEPYVEVTLEDVGDNVRITVSDNGPSIPEDETEVLENRNSSGSLHHGSGLGLWLINWVVMRSAGKLEFDNSTTRGNKVVIYLPKEVNHS